MTPHPQAVYRLALLWAFAESGLGGVLHAFRLPVTGFVLGAFAIIIIYLMAQLAVHPFKEISKATLIVVAIKFAASPHSPLPAYVAVLFQGMCGAVLFQLAKQSWVVTLIYGFLVMIETAMQKPLVATLIFGKHLWIALDELMVMIGLPATYSFSTGALLAYAAVYSVWGICVAVWVYRLPSKLNKVSLPEKPPAQQPFQKQKKNLWIFYVPALLLAIGLGLYLINYPSLGFYLLRTILIMATLYFVVAPIFRWLLLRLQKKEEASWRAYQTELPQLKQRVQWAWSQAMQQKCNTKKAEVFVITLLWFTVYEQA